MTMKHVRYIRCSYIVGWEPREDGFLLMYSDGQRELIPMSAKEADENCNYLNEEMFGGNRDVIGIAWEDALDEDGGGRNLSADIGQDHAPSLARTKSDF